MNNTYGIEAYNQSVADQIQQVLDMPGGCRDLAGACKEEAAEGDSNGFGNNETVVQTCGAAFQACWGGVYYPYEELSGVRYAQSSYEDDHC